MNGIFAAARECQEHCAAQGWQSCIIGGIAVLRWGEPRATQDADLVVFAGLGDEVRFAAGLLAAFSRRVADALQFAVRHRVALLRASNGVALDVALGALPFEERLLGFDA